MLPFHRKMKINRKTLGNGLVVVHVEKPDTNMVSVNVLYRVGSGHEDREHTGFAHLFEHLMFGGSHQAPDFDAELQEAGGENNAFTCEDYTEFYDLLPARNIETALWLESDRMEHLDICAHSLEVQRKVVMEEFKLTSLNQPYGDVPHLLADMAWPAPSSYNWPVIGQNLDHIASATLGQVEDFYRRFYNPANAILCIVGGVMWEDVQRLVDKYFARIPNDALFVRTESVPLAPPIVNHAQKVYRDVPDDLLIRAYRIPSRRSPIFPVCDLISDLLGNGQSSLLYDYFVTRNREMLSVDASVDVRLGNGLLVIEGILSPNMVRKSLLRDLNSVLRTFKKTKVSSAELEKVKNKFEANWELQLSDTQQMAELLAYYELLGDARMILDEVERYRKVTTHDVLEVAHSVMRPSNRCDLFYLHRRDGVENDEE